MEVWAAHTMLNEDISKMLDEALPVWQWRQVLNHIKHTSVNIERAKGSLIKSGVESRTRIRIKIYIYFIR